MNYVLPFYPIYGNVPYKISLRHISTVPSALCLGPKGAHFCNVEASLRLWAKSPRLHQYYSYSKLNRNWRAFQHNGKTWQLLLKDIKILLQSPVFSSTTIRIFQRLNQNLHSLVWHGRSHDAAKETKVLFRKNIFKKRFLEKGILKRGALAHK